MSDNLFFVYILYCENNSLYTGYAANLKRRLKEHFIGSPKCKYTRSFKPIDVIQCWQINGNKALAMRVEMFIKKLDRQAKENLIANPSSLVRLFSCSPLNIKWDATLNDYDEKKYT